ncbi:hypothetical protein I7I53_07117 [Histoplasma capsulatum var. duboisii H88]|uniref:Uncharacterized protein n=1 Tax=Ajellomyces capsulatus (strain H88) TaxID=544711 RepID=A0A8A1LH08_AJEC8|nr:hypothetical protein I7I53_07117 [Histoplasma capsulatum var. duboisii H88]
MLDPFCHSQPACALRRLHSCFCSGHTNTHLSASLSPPPFSVWALCRKSVRTVRSLTYSGSTGFLAYRLFYFPQASCRRDFFPGTAGIYKRAFASKEASQFVDRLFSQYWRSQSVLSSLVECSLFSTPPFPGSYLMGVFTGYVVG